MILIIIEGWHGLGWLRRECLHGFETWLNMMQKSMCAPGLDRMIISGISLVLDVHRIVLINSQ